MKLSSRRPRINGSSFGCGWRSLQREQSAADLSDGTLRFLFLLAALANPSPPPLIAIDEPETGLHPSMLPIVAEYARDAAQHTQVILTTHSPELLDAFGNEPPTTTVVEWKDGQTMLRVLAGDRLDYWLKKYTHGRAIQVQGIGGHPVKFVLLVEGETEKLAIADFLKRWLDPQLKQPVGIKVVNFRGNSQLVRKIVGKAQDYLDSPEADEIVGVIGLLDLYGLDIYPPKLTTAEERHDWAVRHFEEQVDRARFRMFFAVHEFEAWILGQPDVLPRGARPVAANYTQTGKG